jgi:hypothetical protein
MPQSTQHYPDPFTASSTPFVIPGANTHLTQYIAKGGSSTVSTSALTSGQTTPASSDQGPRNVEDAILIVTSYLGLREPPLMLGSKFCLLYDHFSSDRRGLRKALEIDLPGKEVQFIFLVLISHNVF